MQKYEYCPIKINIYQTSAANPDISLQKNAQWTLPENNQSA